MNLRIKELWRKLEYQTSVLIFTNLPAVLLITQIFFSRITQVPQGKTFGSPDFFALRKIP